MSVLATTLITDTLMSARHRVLAATAAHLRGEATAPLYLAGDGPAITALLGAVAGELRAAGRGDRLLVCTGRDFTGLWRDTLRRGLTPMVRRALAARHALLFAGLEALREAPFAQAELARLIAPTRLVVLGGRLHLPTPASWHPDLRAALRGATRLCVHAGPCLCEADAWEVLDGVAGFYGLTRQALLSRRRTAEVAQARQITMLLLRERGLSYAQVGRLLGRDHATVLHGCARIRGLSLRRPDVRRDLEALRQGG